MSLPVAVLAGGLATRLGPIAERVPKVLVDVAGRPFAEHQIDLLRRQGIVDVVWCVGHLGDQVERALGDGTRWAMRFRYAYDGDRPRGTGGALQHALPLVGPACFVMYGDSYLTCPFDRVARAFHESGQPALMTVFRNDNRWDRSNVVFRNGRIERYEKDCDDPDMRHIDYGLGVVTAEAFAPWAGEAAFDLAQVYGRLATERRLAGYEVSERFYEIGSPRGLEDTRALLTRTTVVR